MERLASTTGLLGNRTLVCEYNLEVQDYVNVTDKLYLFFFTLDTNGYDGYAQSIRTVKFDEGLLQKKCI